MTSTQNQHHCQLRNANSHVVTAPEGLPTLRAAPSEDRCRGGRPDRCRQVDDLASVATSSTSSRCIPADSVLQSQGDESDEGDPSSRAPRISSASHRYRNLLSLAPWPYGYRHSRMVRWDSDDGG